jgi:transposase InsO family protein
MSWFTALLLLLRAAVLGRRDLALENLALRQQLLVLKRKNPRPQLLDRDRLFWLVMRKLHGGWKDGLLLIHPATVTKWHRAGWRAYWRRKSSSKKVGRPAIGWPLARLIRRLSLENATWGAPRIRDELVLLGHDVGLMTVHRYMAKGRDPEKAQRWRTFLRNHLQVIAACDFFTVPTITFRNLYVLVILSHDRRMIRHVAVTPHPTAAWAARQLIEAFPEDEPEILLHDRDPLFQAEFARMVEVMGIRDLKTTARSPWMNGYCERVIGTIRRDCTDHIIALGERHLKVVLDEYVTYYNESRTHRSLDGNAPIPRQREAAPVSEVRATPVLGGLHHRYTRAA